MNKKFDKSYRIISNKEICTDYFELKVKAPAAAGYCYPGQFFMISIPGVFLRRPVSIYDVKKDTVSFLYKITGKGTKILSEIKSETIQLLGPLGNGYDLPPNTASSSLKSEKKSPGFSPVIIAGGTGIASVHFLAAKLKTRGTLYYGARSKKDLLCLNKFRKIGWKIIVSTEDGSKGHKGYITNILPENLKSGDTLFACGPMPMLKKILQIAKEKNIRGFASLEEIMACGVGNCQGCAVKIKGQNKMTCKDGSIFKIEDIDF
ncbi:MAG: dihydroorotate dehydrogenase electron transfer subunit [Endomicrobium sp.]|jgi:dihydroorotate dehydrogenase electron transfer subunit|nr:dihydroorotate dehydrogenase electron transfer subunit [Endomicrobium sp.]